MDKEIKFSKGTRYIKAYTEDTTGARSAIGFFDKTHGYWLEAASWKTPGNRISALSDHLDEALNASS